MPAWLKDEELITDWQVAAEEAERLRLAFVAAKRAEDAAAVRLAAFLLPEKHEHEHYCFALADHFLEIVDIGAGTIPKVTIRPRRSAAD